MLNAWLFKCLIYIRIAQISSEFSLSCRNGDKMRRFTNRILWSRHSRRNTLAHDIIFNYTITKIMWLPGLLLRWRQMDIWSCGARPLEGNSNFYKTYFSYLIYFYLFIFLINLSTHSSFYIGIVYSYRQKSDYAVNETIGENIPNIQVGYVFSPPKFKTRIYRIYTI